MSLVYSQDYATIINAGVILSSPKRNLKSLRCLFPPQLLATLIASTDLPVLDISHKYTYRARHVPYPASFIYLNALPMSHSSCLLF